MRKLLRGNIAIRAREDDEGMFFNPIFGGFSPIKGRTRPFIKSKPRVGRNDLCQCGSGLKYKKCCGKEKR